MLTIKRATSIIELNCKIAQEKIVGFNPYHYQEEIEKIMSLRGDREVQHDAADKLIRGFLGWVGENRDLRGTMAGRIASDLASMYDSEQPKWFYS